MKTPAGVLLLTRSLDLGGTERQMTEVAKGLDRTHFIPHVAAFEPSGVRAYELRAADVPVLHLPVTSFASPSLLSQGFKLIRYIRQHEIQLVHSFDVPLNIFAVPFAQMARTPAVVSSQRAHRDLTPGIYTGLLRLTDRMVDGIVVNCLHMRDHLVADERVSPELIYLCYNGIDFSVFHRGRAPAELPKPRVEGQVTIGTVCALRPEKGLPTLVESFARTNRKFPQTRLVIVGSGPMLAELERLVLDFEIGAFCSFIHKTADVAPWMRVMDIFVLPSLSEALSNSLMEAMACGCCCIASRVGGNPELMGESTRGFLFPRADTDALTERLLHLVENSQIRTELGVRGHDFIHRGFSLNQSVRRMEEIYRILLK